MAIIRDEEAGGLLMIPLFMDWRIRRCNIDGCTEKPSTIITGDHTGEAKRPFGLCERHWHELSDTPGEKPVRLVFDGFDAFKKD